MFERYPPQLLGNSEKVVHEVEATPMAEAEAPQFTEQATLVAHKEGDEKRAGFWRTLVSSDPRALVAKGDGDIYESGAASANDRLTGAPRKDRFGQ